MADPASRGASLGSITSRGSIQLLPAGGCESFRSKTTDLIQAMLSEIEDIISEYDSDLGKLCAKSPRSQQDLPDTPRTKAVKKDSPRDVIIGSLRSMSSWGHGSSQLWLQQSMATQSVEQSLDRGNLNVVTRNIYKLLSSELAPKLQALMKEVADLRRQKEFLSDKMEQQIQRNNKQMEEFEELQSELRVKNRQLLEQRRVSKDLDIYQGENAMLKLELKSLRTRVEKLGGRKKLHHEAQRRHEGEEAKWQKTPSNEWLKQENEDLQKEVARWKTENSEKDVLISELKGVIKDMKAPESPRASVQRRVSTAHFRLDSVLSSQSQSQRSLPDLVPLVSHVGGALGMETPRGRFRSIVLEKMEAASRSASPARSLAEDLGTAPGSPRRRQSDGLSTVQAAAAAADNTGVRRGSLLPPTKHLAAPRADGWHLRDHLRNLSEAAVADSQQDKRVRAASEAMERALLSLEDHATSWEKQLLQLQERASQLESALAEADEKNRCASADVEALRAERLTAASQCRETQGQLEAALTEVRGSQRKLDELQAAFDRLQEEHAQLKRENEAALAAQLSKQLSAVSLQQQQSLVKERSIDRGDVGSPAASSTAEAVADNQTAPSVAAQQVSGPVSLKQETIISFLGSLPQACEVRSLEAKPEPSVRKASRTERLRVMYRNPGVDDCCSPFSCFKFWDSSNQVTQPQPLYALEPPDDAEAAMWSARKPPFVLRVSLPNGKPSSPVQLQGQPKKPMPLL
ncbi:hypothetical protein Esti_001775 [Eimeria stiedai]